MNLFSKPEWASFRETSKNFANSGPVAPEDLVSADGVCSAPVEHTAALSGDSGAAKVLAASEPAKPAPQPTMADSTVGTVAGDLGGEAAPLKPSEAAPPSPASPAPPPDRLEPASGLGGNSLPPVLGGIALGMSECQVVRRAGRPGNVSIASGANGGRQVTISYPTGTWPGIYHFADGRLKEIDRAPEAAKPPPKVKKIRKKATRAKTTKGEDVYVQ